MAREAGLTATLLDGGMLAWKKQGLPVVEGKRRLPVDRQVQLTVGVGILTSVGLGLTVNRWFLALAGIFGAGLTYAGLSGTCGLAKALEKAPWNKLESVPIWAQLVPTLSYTSFLQSSLCELV